MRRRDRTQYGGSRTYVGELTPTIQSAASMQEKCSFYFMSAHGATDLSKFVIVPEDTFVLFEGQSGFIAGVGVNPRLADLLAPGINTPEGAYWDDIYATFFKPGMHERRLKRHYDSVIYVPGDIMPSMHLTFLTGAEPWSKGLYELPTAGRERFTWPPHRSSIVFYLLLQDILGELPDRFHETILIPDYIEKGWNDMKDDLQALMQEKVDRGGFFNSSRDLDTCIPPLQEKGWDLQTDKWISDEGLKKVGPLFLDRYEFEKEDNLLLTQGISYTSTVFLDDFFKLVPKPKQYKFIIMNSCRAPIVLPNFDVHKVQGHQVYPGPLTEFYSQPRRFARRASLSTRCSTFDEPSMNVKRLLRLYADTLGHTYKEKERSLQNAVGIFFYTNITFSADSFRLEIRFQETFLTFALAVLSQLVLLPYTVEDTTLEAKRAFEAMLREARLILGTFLHGVHSTRRGDANAIRSIGNEILDQVGSVISLGAEEVDALSPEEEAAAIQKIIKMRRPPDRALTGDEFKLLNVDIEPLLRAFSTAHTHYEATDDVETKQTQLLVMTGLLSRIQQLAIPFLHKRLGDTHSRIVFLRKKLQELQGIVAKAKEPTANSIAAASRIQAAWRARGTRRATEEAARAAAIRKNQNAILNWKRRTLREKPVNRNLSEAWAARRALQTRLERYAENTALSDELADERIAEIRARKGRERTTKYMAAKGFQALWRGRTARRLAGELRRQRNIQKNERAILNWKRNTMRGKAPNRNLSAAWAARRALQTEDERRAENNALNAEMGRQRARGHARSENELEAALGLPTDL